MKIDKSIIVSFVLLVIIAALYRIMPGRPFGFAPQIAMALFAGSVIKDRKISFLLPLISMFISDVIYEVLFQNGLSAIKGFYEGQILNYVLFGGITVIGFFIKKDSMIQIAAGSLIGATAYFLLCNFGVWVGGGLDINSQPYPKTLEGLVACYTAALPFFKMSIYSTLFFSTVLFSVYYMVNKFWSSKVAVA
ncbi:MAG: hypothetical protein HY305_05680 [Sphingobacteriales bacterium]|nr:hypothetical protein [Sphingobacteriales bacterium]